MTFPVQTQTYGSYDYLCREVAPVLGYERNSDLWTHEQAGIIDSVVQRGVRAFYAPPALPGDKMSHEWSFLRPVRTLVTVADTSEYTMPSDFADLVGPLTFAADQSILYEPIELVSHFQIRQRQTESTSTGRPTLAALYPSETAGTWKLALWITPDDAYTIYYRSRIVPVDLSASNTTPYGGKEHAQTILEACLAEAEVEADKERLIHHERFMQRLQASVHLDRRANAPDTLGYNRDRSDGQGWYPESYHEWNTSVITYNGVSY